MPSTAGRITYATAPGQPGFEVEVPQGPPQVSNPLGAVEPTHELFSQVYWQRRAAYRRPTENALCPVSISRGRLAYFVDDSPREPIGTADIVAWTRTWATVPLQVTEYSNISVTYPGYGVIENVFPPSARIVAAGRTEYQATPRCKITTDFYLVGEGSRYSSPDELPLSAASIVTYPSTVTPASSIFYRLGGGFFLANSNGAFSHPNGTSPSLSSYQSAVSTDAATPSSYSQIVESTKPERHLGNIWKVVTTRIKAA